MDYFDCIFYGIFYCRLNGRFSLSDTNVLTQFIIFLFPWPYFLQHLHQEYEGHETLWEHQYGMGKGSLFCLGKSTIYIQKLKFSYYNNLFGNVFQTSGVIGLITILYVRNSDAKRVLQLLGKYLVYLFNVISLVIERCLDCLVMEW